MFFSRALKVVQCLLRVFKVSWFTRVFKVFHGFSWYFKVFTGFPCFFPRIFQCLSGVLQVSLRVFMGFQGLSKVSVEICCKLDAT
jgi:hypothetical protein